MGTLNAFAIVVPTVAVLIGILLNRQDALSIRAELKSVEIALRNEFKSELNAQSASLNAQIGSLRSEMKSEIGQLRGEMIQLRNSVHTDMVGLHERIAVVEAKQQA